MKQQIYFYRWFNLFNTFLVYFTEKKEHFAVKYRVKNVTVKNVFPVIYEKVGNIRLFLFFVYFKNNDTDISKEIQNVFASYLLYISLLYFL